MILTKPWIIRSDEEVNKVVERLQVLRCFVEYPVSFQHKLARLAWLIEVDADLAIIRQGHIAADFYFMLAGSAKMIKLNGSPYLEEHGTLDTLRILRSGDAFGDESMSHPNSERTYSVITTEKSILLSLSSVDYISMLLQTRDDEQAPEHILFLR
ncbi:cyclic nucleotide-binding domain-containing protein 2-like [Plakobranchus ocellatus]|uniref:Cyclic nucleotide-binding domain-containing protein 2-like n=1 Tax=Plakobranchus ocellatus TaxID=259542 RepID=A0AAV4DJQ7_9GAST|nr:cyclic nucleotide-binding domain-containing protein 2-like [Plakobranchus ocellatus]